MKVIGITGGVGSGKSELLRYMESHYSCRMIRSDELACQMEKPGGAIYSGLLAILREEIEQTDTDARAIDDLVMPNGEINRAQMATLVFGNGRLLKKVNALVHPAVIAAIQEAIAEEREKKELDFFFIEAALLIENGFLDIVDEMWYIRADRQVRIERLKKNRGYSEEKIEKIMDSQLSDEEFLANCHVTIENSTTIEDACRQIDEQLKGSTTI